MKKKYKKYEQSQFTQSFKRYVKPYMKVKDTRTSLTGGQEEKERVLKRIQQTMKELKKDTQSQVYFNAFSFQQTIVNFILFKVKQYKNRDFQFGYDIKPTDCPIFNQLCQMIDKKYHLCINYEYGVIPDIIETLQINGNQYQIYQYVKKVKLQANCNLPIPNFLIRNFMSNITNKDFSQRYTHKTTVFQMGQLCYIYQVMCALMIEKDVPFLCMKYFDKCQINNKGQKIYKAKQFYHSATGRKISYHKLVAIAQQLQQMKLITRCERTQSTQRSSYLINPGSINPFKFKVKKVASAPKNKYNNIFSYDHIQEMFDEQENKIKKKDNNV